MNTISPIKFSKINNISHNYSFRGNNQESNSSERLKSLIFLETKLLNAKNMLKSANKKKNEPLLLEYQINDLIQHIGYIKEYLFKENPKKEKDYEKNILTAGFSSDEDFIAIENQAKELLSLTNKKLGIEVNGRDLVLNTGKIKFPKSFEKSDMLLTLDEYQKTAIEDFKNGNTVMVTAPTGTGKTLIAEHIIDDILKKNKKVIYTTPLKALCNDKYKQFSKLWGDYDDKGELIGTSRIGLATGDAKINVNAPLVIMTTEIYRNMLVQQSLKSVEKELKDVDAVIFDEFHYMGDTQRGSVWEESIMFSPEKMRFLMLSATISNASPIKDWICNINSSHNATIINVPEEERYVPLKHYVYADINNKFGLYDLTEDSFDIDIIKNKSLNKQEKTALKEIGQKLGENDGIAALDKILGNIEHHRISSRTLIKELVKSGINYSKAQQYAIHLSDKDSKSLNPILYKMNDIKFVPMKDFILELNQKRMLPALYFTYSKKSCKKYMEEASNVVGTLLTHEEQQEIQKRIFKIKQKGIFLGSDFEEEIRPCLLKGFAMHHSGMLPQCKSFIEELGRSKLVKVCFATDTLGAGINFPFKTVVFSDFEKFGDCGFEEISVNSFKQGAGRAGRRGIDDIGYVVSIPKGREELIIPFNKITQPSDEIQSSFKLSYGLILSPRFLNSFAKVLDNSFDNFQRKSYDANFQKAILMQGILKERKMIEYKNNKYHITQKGKIASQIRGINEILMAEILTNTFLMENITPSELAGLISMFAPDKEEKINLPKDSINKKYSQKIIDTISIAQNIKNLELAKGLESNININNSSSDYVKQWANIVNNEEVTDVWSNFINEMLSKNIIKNEGDFLKKINYTINILKQIKKSAPTPYLQNVAEKAVKMLQKSPVNDILLYELNYKENNE